MRFTTEIYELKSFVNPALGLGGVVVGVVSGVVSILYGESVNMYVVLLLLAVVTLDWLGNALKLKDGSYYSDYGIRGIFVLLLIGRLIDVISGIPIVVADLEISGFYLFLQD